MKPYKRPIGAYSTGQLRRMLDTAYKYYAESIQAAEVTRKANYKTVAAYEERRIHAIERELSIREGDEGI